VIATKGRYRPMPLERAFEVALKRRVTDKQFVVEIDGGQVRLALPWRAVMTGEARTRLRPDSLTDAQARVRDERPDALRIASLRSRQALRRIGPKPVTACSMRLRPSSLAR
jgi:hypothetical protein